jgi:antitoxin (DNA-binding transcriptional repressor) of toxin-antitoxin stability system
LKQFNLKLNLMSMKTITMLELRQNAGAIVRDLRQGRSLTLTYRGQPLARLEPILPSGEEISADDPFYTLADHAGLAEDEALAKGNANLTNADIDRVLYGG